MATPWSNYALHMTILVTFQYLYKNLNDAENQKTDFEAIGFTSGF